MSVQGMLSEAERAAGSGDLASAEDLLREAARLQEEEFGPFHPELANTLNNLAVIAEQTDRPDEAEKCYRRAVAIASTALPPGDPMVAASRQNLEDFCRAHGRPIEEPTATVEPAAVEATPTQSKPTASPRSLAAEPKMSRLPAMLGLGVAVLLAIALLIARPWSSTRQALAVTPVAEPVPAPPVEPAPAKPAPEAPAPTERTPEAAAVRPPASASAPAGIALATVQLCRNFSPDDWRCDPAGESVAPGPIVLYTRVRSPRDAVVVHRWFQGESLRKSAQLRVGASPTEGYRTFSRQTVDRGEWRVEVRSTGGDLLFEQSLTVR
jgi:hypothetical protein